MDDTATFEVIKRNVLAVVPDLSPDEVSPQQSLAALGCNSIDRMEIVTMTMEQLGVTVPVAAFADVRDVASLVRLLNDHADSAAR